VAVPRAISSNAFAYISACSTAIKSSDSLASINARAKFRRRAFSFPHDQLSAIVENAAMQLAHGKDQSGNHVMSDFKATSFELGRGPAGEAVLSLIVGQRGKISFLMPGGMPGQLSESLQKLAH
jgi:hypothetical protein